MHNITLCLLTTKNIRPGVSSALRIAGCQIQAIPQRQSWNHGRSGLSSDKHARLAKWHVSRSDTVLLAAGQLDLHNPLLGFSETPQKASPRRQRIFRFRLWSDKKAKWAVHDDMTFFLTLWVRHEKSFPFWRQQQKWIQHFIWKSAPPLPPVHWKWTCIVSSPCAIKVDDV